MMTQTQIIPLPIKGVNRNMPRGVQPEGTCWDALNVLPFDRQGRTRLALRGGAGKVETLAAANKVRLLHVASFASTPTSGATTVFSDSFEYTNGPLNTQGSWTDVASTDGWSVLSNDAVSGQGGTGFQIADQSDTVMSPLTIASDDYTVTIVLKVTTAGNDLLFEVFPESDNAGNPTVQGNYKVDVQWNGGVAGSGYISVVDQNSNPTLVSYDPPVDSDITLKIVVASRKVAVSVNGTTIVSNVTISATNTAFKRFAFLAFSSLGGDGDVIVRSILITKPGTVSLNRTQEKLIACSGTDTYFGEPASMTVISNSGTFPVSASSLSITATTLFGFTYIVDGTNIRKLNLATPAFTAYTASAGSAPTSTTIAVSYRGRLVLSGSTGDPQNVFASKIGDPTNWDYSATGPDRAWAGNESKAGRVGAPVQALMPLSDDIMIIGCESSTWAVRGDPADGGSIDNISNSAGVMSQTAWDIAADGSLYFVGTNGLYKANPDGSSPMEVSRDSYRQFFQSLDRSTQHVNLIYDRTRYGLWIFVTPEDQANAPAVSLFYDLRLEGFWPIEFTNMPEIGPITAVYWDGFDSDVRYPVLGGYDGRLSVMSFVNRRDNDGVANQLISGYVVLGPIGGSATDEAILSRLDVTGGEVKTGDAANVWHLAWKINAGQSAYSVTEGTPLHTASGTFTFDKRQVSRTQRVRGQWFSIRLGNENNAGDYFTLEQIAIGLNPAGRSRRPG